MRLNLNVRNASSTSFNNNTFTINFNVSKFIKFQQLNENARIYIESVNLIDITDTNLNAKIEGNIEIRCDFITNDDFSTSNDNNPLLFNNTLYQSETIRNNNSMYNMNYKCNTNAFRSGNINLYIKFHDNVGKILKDVSFINTAHAGYATYLADLAALNLKAGEIVAQEAVVEAQNNIILNDQTFVDNFENMKNIKDIDVDIARRELRSQVLVKLNASVVSGGNRPIWVALLAFISDVNNSDLDVYNYYNFPVGEHLRPSDSEDLRSGCHCSRG